MDTKGLAYHQGTLRTPTSFPASIRSPGAPRTYTIDPRLGDSPLTGALCRPQRKRGIESCNYHKHTHIPYHESSTPLTDCSSGGWAGRHFVTSSTGTRRSCGVSYDRMIAFFVLFSFLERWRGRTGGNQRNTIVCAYFILSRGIGWWMRLSLALPLYYSFIVTDLHRLLCCWVPWLGWRGELLRVPYLVHTNVKMT